MNRFTATPSSRPGPRLSTLAVLLALAGPAMAAEPLDTEIANLVYQYRLEHKIPGVTVSVRRDGIELFAKGYGTANSYSDVLVPMTADTTSLMGSDTKPLVTGGGGYQAIKQSGGKYTLDSKVYGTGAVFGQTYAGDLTIGVQRHTPIAGIAIGTDNKVHTWYMNGTYSIGSSNFLGQSTSPYTLPAGRKPVDILGSAIANNGQVYTWYRRGGSITRSIGTPTDLDAVVGETTPCGSTPQPGCVDIKVATGKSIESIVGIAMAKSNNNVYVWYDDGTVSRGTWADFDFYAPAKPFATPAGLTAYDLREVDIAANDHVYAWYRNNKASSGFSLDLDYYIAPYTYAIPESGYTGVNWYAWYADISLQDLLRHRAGFLGSGDGAGAAHMFGKDPDDLTYQDTHRHFLRTRPLLAAPGAQVNYSNHGFGMWALLMPAITGKSFVDYVRDDYLKPMGMDKLVTLASATPGPNDAAGYALDSNGNPYTLPFAEAASPAAGGYRASARSMTRISSIQLAKYGWNELPNMGWLGAGNGRLGHEGALAGGNALMLLYPDGSQVNGTDMSGIHVAIATNLWNNTKARQTDMYALAEAIASKVSAAK